MNLPFQMNKKAVFVIFIFLLHSSLCFAESAVLKRGRLPDGRAYRVNDQGMRLIDQMAELEVTVDDLKRQVRALEEELEEKNRIIGRLSKGEDITPPAVKEETLKVDSSRIPADSGRIKDPPNCNQLVSTLYLKVSRLESQLKNQQERSKNTAYDMRPVQAAECDYESRENPLWEQVTRLQNELMKSPSAEQFEKLKSEKEQLEVDVVQLEQKNNKASNGIETLQEEYEEAVSQLTSLEKKNANLEKELQSAKAALDAEQARAKLSSSKKTTSAKSKPVSKTVQKRAEEASPTVIAASKKEFSGSLKSIQTKILKRKDLHDALGKKRRSVGITLQPLVAKSGLSLDDVRMKMKTLRTENDIRRVRRALSEIEAVIDEDISVLKRLL